MVIEAVGGLRRRSRKEALGTLGVLRGLDGLLTAAELQPAPSRPRPGSTDRRDRRGPGREAAETVIQAERAPEGDLEGPQTLPAALVDLLPAAHGSEDAAGAAG